MGARGPTANLSQRQATSWQPQRRLAGDRAPVTVSSSVLLIPCPQPGWPCSFLFALLSVRFLHSESQRGSAHFPTPHISLVCSPTPPRGSHLVSPLPRGVSSIPGASGAPPSPPRAAAPDCPNAILESLAPAESCVWTSRAAAPKPRGGEAGRSAGRSPGHPGPRRSPRGAGRAPSSRGAAATGFPGIPGPGLGEAGDHRPRRRGELRPRVPHVHAPAPPPPGRLRARPAGEGEPGSTAPSTRAARAVTSPPRGWEARRAEVT